MLPGHTRAGLVPWTGPGRRAARSDVVRLTGGGSWALAGAELRIHSDLCGSFDLC